MKDYGDRGGCYPPQPPSVIDDTKAESIIVSLFMQNNS